MIALFSYKSYYQYNLIIYLNLRQEIEGHTSIFWWRKANNRVIWKIVANQQSIKPTDDQKASKNDQDYQKQKH